MTDEHRPRDPADDEAIADSLDIDETAAQHPAPGPGGPDGHGRPTAGPAGVPAPGAGPEPSEPGPSVPHEPRPVRRPVEPGPPSGQPPQDPVAQDPVAQDPVAQDPLPEHVGSEAPPSSGRKNARKAHRKAPWWEFPALIALAVLIAILVKSFLVQPFYIPSESMEKTLHGCSGCSGDRILVNKIIYDFRNPHPGDIVVFHAPTGWNDEPPSVPPNNPVLRAIRGFGQLIGFVPPDGMVLVKRVIAVGGQTVKGDSAGNVYISDHGPGGPWRKLNEPYKYETGPDPRAKFGPVTVPKGRLWVMGDHRDRSADSRYHCGIEGNDGPYDSRCLAQWATVPISKVIGKAFVIAWPPSRWRTLGTPKTFTSAGNTAAGAVLPLGLVGPLYVARRRRRRRRRAPR